MSIVEKYMFWVVVLTAAGLVAADSATTTTTAPTSQPSSAVIALRQEVSVIARQVEFTPEQWREMDRKIVTLIAGQKAWIETGERQMSQVTSRLRRAERARADRSEITALKKQRHKLRVRRDKLFNDRMSVVLDVMTREQRLKYETAKLYPPALRICKQAGADEEDKARAMQVCRAYAARIITAESWREKSNIGKELRQTILRDVLSEAQWITFEATDLHRSATSLFNKAKLTEEQSAQIMAICREIGSKRKSVENWRDRASLRRAMLIIVYEDILTDDQKKLVRRPRSPRPQRPRRQQTTRPAPREPPGR